MHQNVLANAERLGWCFVAVGVILRAARYLLNFPLWCDEYQLAANFLDRDFAGLLRPLDHNQVAPVGFLWIELAATRVLGFAEWSLRLFPAACGIASVFLFRRVATALLEGPARLLAIAVFAVSYYPIRHGAEVKPYSSDLFCALVLLALASDWWTNPDRRRGLWGLAVVAPLTMALSFPAVFVAGGLSLGIAWTLWQRQMAGGQRGAVTAWATFNLALGAAFVTLLWISVSGQFAATRREMTACWADGFPPWSSPWQFAGWLAMAHTGPMFAYPVGAENGGSAASFLLFLCGMVVLVRGPRPALAVAIGGSLALSLAAAALERYPYGSHARLAQYLAPSICLAIGCGAEWLIDRLREVHWRRAALRASLAACGLIAGGLLARDVLRPYKSATDRDHRAFARRFWESSDAGATLCVQEDLGLRLYSGSFETAYRCHRRMYARDAAGTAPARASAVLAAASGPLRCVVFHSASARRDETAHRAWLDGMLTRYELAATETHHVPLSRRSDRLYDFYDQCYDVYCFRPRQQSSPAAPPLAAAPTEESPRR